MSAPAPLPARLCPATQNGQSTHLSNAELKRFTDSFAH
jgi:hypothetical protein